MKKLFLTLLFISFTACVNADTCIITSHGFTNVNGILQSSEITSTIEYQTFKTQNEAVLFAKNHNVEDNIIFNSTTNEYLVFSYMPKNEFICTNMKEK